jgi:hypothetical protein
MGVTGQMHASAAFVQWKTLGSHWIGAGRDELVKRKLLPLQGLEPRSMNPQLDTTGCCLNVPVSCD